MPTHESLYSAYKARDARFDGRFFIGISTTGIYCRPVCHARLPKEENCTFFSSAAEAEKAGYRPCLLCRPELAPGVSTADAYEALASNAAKILEQNCKSGMSLTELSERMGCTDRHLRRVFKAKYNVSPAQYLQTCRLLLAKNLLTESGLSMLEVAMASGFGSLRRFNDVFLRHYRMPPSALRKKISEEKKQSGDFSLALGYRPPYQFEKILNFLSGRTISGVELVKGDEYLRTVHLTDLGGKPVYGWIKVSHQPSRSVLTVTVSEGLLTVLPQVLARVRHLFDLCCDPHTVYEALSPMNDIKEGLCVPGTRLPGCFSAFEMAVRAVLGQQITVKAASTLAGRLAMTFGTPIQTEIEGLTHIFPSPENILSLEGEPETHLGPLGIISSRAKTIRALAAALKNGEIDLDFPSQPEEEIKKLMTIPGIGGWTAQYIAMRAMGYTDAFLETDVGIKKALAPRTAKELLQLAEGFRPWRSYMTINLWHSL